MLFTLFIFSYNSISLKEGSNSGEWDINSKVQEDIFEIRGLIKVLILRLTIQFIYINEFLY